jgi:putative ABC transport system permease protein
VVSRRFWLRWSWRDLRRRWLQVAATALVIAIGTGLYAGLGGLRSWREESNDLSFAKLAYHDLRVDLSEGSYVRAGRLIRALRRMRERGAVSVAEERLVVPTQVDATRPGRTVLVPGQIVGVPLASGEPRVDRLWAGAGRVLRASDAGRNVAVLGHEFARHYDLAPSGRVRLGTLGGVRYVGQGYSPQHFVTTGAGGSGVFGGEATFAVVYAPIEVAQRSIGRVGRVNELLLRVRRGTRVPAVERDVRSALSTALPGVGVTVTRGTEEASYRLLYDDARNDQRIFNVFAYLLLGGAAFAAFNLISRVVESERREIGIGMALGVPPRELALRPMLMGAEIALLGVVFGIGAGIAIAELLKGVFQDQLPLPIYATPFRVDVFALGAGLGLVLPLAATAYPVWRGVRVSPIEAIRVGFSAAKGAGFAPILKRVTLPGSSLAQMPLRNVLRAPRRTIMTLLGLAAVITSAFALAAMIDSFLATVDRIESETLHEGRSRLDLRLDRFDRVTSSRVRKLEQAPVVGTSESGLHVEGELRSDRDSIDVSLGLADASSQIWRPTISEGSFRPGSSGIVIARKAADDLGLEVGDAVILRHPVRRGPAFFDLVDSKVEVTGIHPNPFRVYAYMDSSQAQLFGLNGYTNSISIIPAAGTSQDEVKRALFGRPGVASVQPVAAETEEVKKAVDEFTVVIRVTEIVALGLALLMAFNSTSISVDERRREYATMFAFGVPVRSGLRVAMVESLVTGVLGTLLGIAFGTLLVGWVVNDLLAETLPDLGAVVSVSAGSIAGAVVVGVGAVTLAPLLTLRRMRRMDIPATLRVVE